MSKGSWGACTSHGIPPFLCTAYTAHHTVLPRATLTQFEVGRITLRGMEASVAQDNHLLFALSNEPLKGIVRHIGRVTCPPDNQSPLIEQQTEFAADNPAVMREAFPADLLRAAALAYRVDQLHPIRVDDAEHRWSSQEDLRPGVMRLEERGLCSSRTENWEVG